MLCPECKTPHAYQGILGWDCVQPGCKHFKNGAIHGKKVRDIAHREIGVNDPVWVDRGGGWHGTLDGFLMVGTVLQIHYSVCDGRPERIVVRLLENYPTPDGTDWIAKGCHWDAHPDHVIYRPA